MAIVTEKAKHQQEDQDIREVLARATKFYQKFETFGKQLDQFTYEFKGLKADIVQMLNTKEALHAKLNELEEAREKAEKSAQLGEVRRKMEILRDEYEKKLLLLESKTKK